MGPQESAERDMLSFRLAENPWTGYIIVGEELRPLPIGARLDPAIGVFSWQLAPAFLGEYRFAFIGYRGGFQVRVNLIVNVETGLNN